MKRTLINQDELWAGSHSSLEATRELECIFQIPEQMAASYGSDKVSAALGYSVQDGVAIIGIRGTLLNVDLPREVAGWYGVSTYPLIQESLAAAASDPAVKHILLDINSPGGAVSGVSDTADMIREINDNIKPVTSFTDGMMASGGYWLGSAAGKVYSSKVAAVGSIGVIQTHIERSRQLQDAGIAATVLRAGEYKALSSPYEPLNDKAKAQIMESLQHTYAIFVDHVATNRGVSPAVVRATMAEGRVFYGSDAEQVKLTDGTTTFQALLSQLTQSVAVDNGNKRQENASIRMQKRSDMSDQQKEASQAAAEEQEKVEDTEEGADKVDASPAAPSVANGNPLEPLLASAQNQIVELRVQLQSMSAAQAEVDTLRSQVTQLSEIAQQSLNQMRIALGASAFNTSDVSALLSEHRTTSENFAKTFPVGGVAAVVHNDEGKPQVADKQDPALRARVRQATFKPK